MSRHRNYCFTDFTHYDECGTHYGRVFATGTPTPTYLVAGRELCPLTGAHHVQGYVEFGNAVSLATVQRCLENPVLHLEPRKGTSTEASDYCKKDKDFVELGTLSRPGTRNDFTELR